MDVGWSARDALPRLVPPERQIGRRARRGPSAAKFPSDTEVLVTSAQFSREETRICARIYPARIRRYSHIDMNTKLPTLS